VLYLVAIFCSPLALLLAGRPISAVFNLVLYVLSIAFWLTIILHSVGFLLWGVAFIHAIVAIADIRAERRTRRLIASARR
jgi:hypothetical protein